VDERKNLPEHETLIRRYCATTPKPKSKFTELMLLYRLTPKPMLRAVTGLPPLDRFSKPSRINASGV
jgi:hypothetical protein